MDLYTKYRLQKLIASQSKRDSAKFLRALIYLFLRYVCFTMGNLRHVNAQLRFDNILRPFWVQMLFLFNFVYLFALFLFVLLLLHRKTVRTS